MTLLKPKIIPGSYKRTKRVLLCKCDICEKEFVISHCVKDALKREYHFCSKECRSKAHRRGGITQIKSKQTCQEHYGVDNPLQSQEIQEKIKATCLERYDVEHPWKSKKVQEKNKATCQEHYGVEYPLQSKEIQNKTKITCLERFGHECSLHGEEAKEKTKLTCQEKYGVEHHWQSQEIQKKNKTTCYAHFGVDNPSQSQEIQEKIKATCLERYDVEHPMHCKEIFDKVQRSNRKAKILLHWKTGEELTCTASYEIAVVTWLNENKTDFEWQIRFETPLLTPTGRKSFYTIDLHILDGEHEDIWVEIKGRENKLEKWEWFHSQYSNSELWNLSRLKQLGIL